MIGNEVICSNCFVIAEYQVDSTCNATDFKCPVCNTTDWDIVESDDYSPEYIEQCIANLKFYKFVKGES